MGSDGAVQRGYGPVTDAGLSFRAKPAGAGGFLHLVYEAGDHAFALEYRSDGSITLCYGERPFEDVFPSASGEAPCKGIAPPLEPGKTLEIAFHYLDGAFQLSVDGDDVFAFPVDVREFREQRRFGSGAAVGPPNAFHLGAAGTAFTIDRIELLRDFEYSDQHKLAGREATFVADGHYFVLGDNSRDSKDSRTFGPIPASAIVGRPVGVMAPSDRLRLFIR
jgi:hypothetical protein